MFDPSKVKSKNKFELGPCVPNCYLEKIEYKDNRLIMHYTREGVFGPEGMSDSMFEINEQFIIDRIKPNAKTGLTPTPDEAIQKEIDNMSERINHICSEFLPFERIQLIKGSLKEIALLMHEEIIASGIAAKTPVYLKTIPNKSGYSELPKFRTFIQAMQKGPCMLTYTKYEGDLILKYISLPSSGITEAPSPFAAPANNPFTTPAHTETNPFDAVVPETPFGEPVPVDPFRQQEPEPEGMDLPPEWK